MKYKKILLVTSLIMFLGACSKLTKDNYDQLENGMHQEEIESIIGSPDDCKDRGLGTKFCLWGNEEGKSIKVAFHSGRAIAITNSGIKDNK